MKAIHYVLLAFGIIVTSAPQIEAAFPASAAVMKIAATVFGVLVTAVGMVSPAALHGVPGAPTEKAPEVKP